ncbi:Centromere protein E_ 312kDa [Caligus rogercresseyi]|uniref:Centromere protein E_ 312kDa n=1 Tax=Caligus rogercresseyi TaxID=217165 RepID=A0A7T8GSG2_CALRO|nr:Centromere protein E_ 312kDa [Caligus rogercresseyi]
MESNYSTSEAEKDRLSRELKDLREKSEFLEREKEDFEFRFSLLEDKYKKKEMDLIQSLNEARSMSGSPNTSSDPSPFGDVTLSAIEELTKRLESLQNYVNDLEDEVRSNKEGVSAKDTLIEELTLKSSDAESLQAIIAELKVSNEGKDEEIRRLNTEQSTSQSMQEASSNTEEEEELSHLKNELYTSKEKISELEDNAMVILNDYEILEKDKAELESQNEALQNKIKALSSVDQETNEDEKDAVLKELRDSLERYSVEIQSLSEEKRKLLHALTEKEAQIKNNQIVKCKFYFHTEGSSETNAKLQDTIKELSEKTDTISILSFECKDLSSQVQALKDQVSKLSEAKTDLQLKNEKLESNLKSQHKEESSNVDDGKIVSLESESSSKKNEEIEAMKADLNIVTAELDNIKTENKKLGDLLREKESLLLSTNINKRKTIIKVLCHLKILKVTTLEHNLKDKSDSLSKFEDENQKLRAKISELESESSRKGNELHDLRSLLDKINSELSSASEEQMKLQQVVAEKEFLLKDSKEKSKLYFQDQST